MTETNSICKKVLDTNSKIRFAGIISDKGKLIIGEKRDGIQLLVDDKHHEMLFMEVALRVRMRREFDKELGPVDFTVSSRGKVIIMSFPCGNDILYVSAEKDIDLGKVPYKILQATRVECH